MVSQQEQGFVTNAQGERVILLPSGPIRPNLETVGTSGTVYSHVLVDSPDLGRPVAHMQVPMDNTIRPW